MRILHLLASPVWSGPAELVANLASAQRALGHEVTVAVDAKRPGLGSEEPARPRLHELGLLDDGGLELSVKSSPGAVLADLRRLKTRAVDVLHSHFSHDHLLSRFGRPDKATLIRSIHAPRSLRWSLPNADGYTVPAASMLSALGPRKGMVLPAIVDRAFVPSSDRAALRRALGLCGAPLIGMVSTFQSSRRHDVGLDAFAKVVQSRPQARLVLVGDGLLEPALRERARSLGVAERVTFAGYQPGDAFVRHLQALDEVWILGLGNDWSGRAAAQARACGVRVVAVDEGALRVWADGVTEPSASSVAEASLAGSRRQASIAGPEELAARVLDFYAQCRQKARA